MCPFLAHIGRPFSRAPFKTYITRKLCPSLASNQTAYLKAALVENTTRSEARHSLIVSLHVPETDVALVSAVQIKMDTLTASQIEITF